MCIAAIRVFVLAGLTLGLVVPALAQDRATIEARMEERMRQERRLNECAITEVSYTEMTPDALLQGMGPIPARPRGLERIVRTVWTGGCVEGKLDGVGTLEKQYYGAPGSPSEKKPMKFRRSGLMVRGQSVGPWLTEDSPMRYTIGAYFWADTAVPGDYIKRPDGAFQLAQVVWTNGGQLEPVQTSEPVPAAEVARHIAAAKQRIDGGVAGQARTAYSSKLLADLLRRGQVFRAASQSLGQPKTSTVALLLSTHSEASLKAIDELAAQTRTWGAQRVPVVRAAATRLADVLSSKAVTQGLTDVLREYYAKVVFVQDLAEVDRQAVDHVAIVDVGFRHGGSAMLDELLKDASTPIPAASLGTYMQSTSPLAIRTGFSFFILDKQFDVLRAYESEPAPLGLSRPTPPTEFTPRDPRQVADAVVQTLDLQTTLLKDKFSGSKYTYTNGDRAENFGALTMMLRAHLDKP